MRQLFQEWWRLSRLGNRPWRDIVRGKEVTELWVSQQLRVYGVKPDVADWEERVKGYLPEKDFSGFLRILVIVVFHSETYVYDLKGPGTVSRAMPQKGSHCRHPARGGRRLHRADRPDAGLVRTDGDLG